MVASVLLGSLCIELRVQSDGRRSLPGAVLRRGLARPSAWSAWPSRRRASWLVQYLLGRSGDRTRLRSSSWRVLHETVEQLAGAARVGRAAGGCCARRSSSWRVLRECAAGPPCRREDGHVALSPSRRRPGRAHVPDSPVDQGGSRRGACMRPAGHAASPLSAQEAGLLLCFLAPFPQAGYGMRSSPPPLLLAPLLLAPLLLAPFPLPDKEASSFNAGSFFNAGGCGMRSRPPPYPLPTRRGGMLRVDWIARLPMTAAGRDSDMTQTLLGHNSDMTRT